MKGTCFLDERADAVACSAQCQKSILGGLVLLAEIHGKFVVQCRVSQRLLVELFEGHLACFSQFPSLRSLEAFEDPQHVLLAFLPLIGRTAAC